MPSMRYRSICIIAITALSALISRPVYADNTAPITKPIEGGHLKELLDLKNANPQLAPSAPSSGNQTQSGPPDLVPGLSVAVLIGETDNPLAAGTLKLGPLNAIAVNNEGCSFPWTYYVKNDGTGPTNNAFHASLIVMKAIDGELRTIKVETNLAPALAGGHASPISGTLVLGAGLYQLDVLVDRGNKVAEINENNNRHGRLVEVAKGCGGSS